MGETTEPRLYEIRFAIVGNGFAAVMADSEDEAIAKFHEGVFAENPEIEDWDTNTDGYRGGYIEASPAYAVEDT